MLNTLSMKSNKLFSWVFMLSACALLAIGRVYDERLVIAGFNLVLFICLFFLVSIVFLLFSIKKMVLSKSKVLFYMFYLSVLVLTPILWMLFNVTEFGLEKYLNFCLIVVPVSIVIIEKYDREDVVKTLYILLGVTCFLALLSFIGLSVSDRVDGRMAALGGGPIVFARWMGFGIISLFLLPLKVKSRFKYVLIFIFFLLALASGSRGPILSLLITFLIYVFLNFNKVIVKVSFGFIFLISIVIFSGAGKQLTKVGKFDRVFMNVSEKGWSKQSTSTRTNLAVGSFIILQNYPLGVGAGNWQEISNQLRPTHLMPLEYPHNLFLEVACEYGLPTLLILILMFVYVLYLSYNKMLNYRSNASSLYPLLFYLFIFFLLNSLVSGMLNDSRLLFIIISFILLHKPLLISVDE
jgi:O-antigen ligase